MTSAADTLNVYFHNSLCTILYCSGGYVRLDWTDADATAADLGGIYEHTLAALKRHRTTKLLTNHTLRQPMAPEVQQWLAHEWIPRAIREAGYSQCAILESQKEAGRAAAHAVGDAVFGFFSFKYFNTSAEAHAWLVSQDSGTLIPKH
ncbi:hypothetical protein [Hymenobacter jejuensis]|uniref:STAS/SEC14 domain-containing protein n=1 Tax=Hymenobacter jejuensis TaxID=2502781 RepID=A0A5B8A4M0_9BACT|nr:hypothetical protein [Hymenobacter jejuensis]QDA61563.1 hypothetical protein FHG12_16305 [Hymenobacter jejuensis]